MEAGISWISSALLLSLSIKQANYYMTKTSSTKIVYVGSPEVVSGRVSVELQNTLLRTKWLQDLTEIYVQIRAVTSRLFELLRICLKVRQCNTLCRALNKEIHKSMSH